ncbi:MAG: hypothetical protein NTY19_00490 [Planctomycetota bacterium]|nr:hypothetical protein [Planctomycetota bacterium]
MDDKKATEVKPPPNVWMLSGEHNPYLHNAFALLRVDPDSGQEAIRKECRRLSGRLAAGQQVLVSGHVIVETDVAHAKGLAQDAEAFVAERLLAHTVHAIEPRDLEPQMKALESVPFESPQALLPLPIRDLSFLTRLLPTLPELQAEKPVPLSTQRLQQAVQPSDQEEDVYDL